MPKPPEPESYESTEYGEVDGSPRKKGGDMPPAEKYRVVREIADYVARETPNAACRVSMSGDSLRILYVSYEMHLPARRRAIEEAGRDYTNEFVRFLKKEFKARTGKTLDLKEDRSRESSTIEKVNLNERYMYSCSRFYEIS